MAVAAAPTTPLLWLHQAGGCCGCAEEWLLRLPQRVGCCCCLGKLLIWKPPHQGANALQTTPSLHNRTNTSTPPHLHTRMRAHPPPGSQTYISALLASQASRMLCSRSSNARRVCQPARHEQRRAVSKSLLDKGRS
eukprot:363986-Chlamydomonas_euryale.AAC.1